MRFTHQHHATLPVDVERQLVASLFGGIVPLCLIGAMQCLGSALAAWWLADPLLIELTMLGVVACCAHMLVVGGYRRARPATADMRIIRGWEARYAVASTVFAAVIGATAMRVFWSGEATAELLFAGALFSALSAMVARGSLRPRIGLLGLAFAALPGLVALLARDDAPHLGVACILALGLISSVERLGTAHRNLVGQILDNRAFASLARVDPLTSLPNRLFLAQFLDEALAALAPEALLAVHCLDLDRFKQANDRFGHLVGDEVLQAFAARVTTSLRPGDLMARLGGDEFVIVQCGLRREADAERLACRVVELLAEPFAIRGHTISIGVSIGIALAPTLGRTTGTVMAAADAALYGVKRGGRNGYAVAGRSPVARVRSAA